MARHAKKKKVSLRVFHSYLARLGKKNSGLQNNRDDVKPRSRAGPNQAEPSRPVNYGAQSETLPPKSSAHYSFSQSERRRRKPRNQPIKTTVMERAGSTKV